jgi:hypothetical protein
MQVLSTMGSVVWQEILGEAVSAADAACFCSSCMLTIS